MSAEGHFTQRRGLGCDGRREDGLTRIFTDGTDRCCLDCGCLDLVGCGMGLGCNVEAGGIEVVLHGLLRGGTPPLPGDKPFGCFSLAVVMAAKFGQTNGLSLNLGKQTGYGLNAKPPAPAEGFS